MDRARMAVMLEATRLTREGRLAEATALLGEGVPHAAPFVQEGARQPSRRAARQRSGPFTGAGGSVTLEDLLSHLPRAGGARFRTRAPSAAPEARWPGRWLHGSYANRAGQRDYRLYVPSSYTGQRVPLITMLHGGTQTADDFAAGTRMNEVAERHSFLVVYSEQSASANPMRYWNWFQPEHQHRDAGEPSLIAGLTRQLAVEYAVDGLRSYVAGFSAGAAMAAVMAACYPDVYAAVGVHSGLAYGVARDVASAFAAMKNGGRTRSAAGNVPLIVFHGDSDPTVDPVNAECLVDGWLGAAERSSPRPRGASHAGQVPEGRRYTRTVFSDGERGAVLEQWTIIGGGHAWAGGSPQGSYTDPLGPDASAELARFFLHHGSAAPVARRRARRSPPAQASSADT